MRVYHNTPSVGYIKWEDVSIAYKGAVYAIPDGNTNKRYVFWKYSDPNAFYGSDAFPTLTYDDLLVFLNKNGTYAVVPKTQVVDGSLIVSESIMTDALAANSVTAEKVAAGAISATHIAADAIGAGAIMAGAVGAEEIAAGVIATNHLAALAVTADKIAANAVTADKIKAGVVSADKLSIGVSNDIQEAKAGTTGPIDADSRPIGAVSNQITLDTSGLKMKPTGATTNAMLLDSKRLAFWDQNGDPAIAIGDVLGLPDTGGMKYGLAIWQGEMRATQGVLSESLSQLGTTTAHLANGGVTLKKLSDVLSVTIPDRFMVIPRNMVNPGFETGDLTGWTGTGEVGTGYKRYGDYGVKNPNLYQDLVAVAGQKWAATCTVKGLATGASAYIDIMFLDASKAILSTKTGSKTSLSTTSWSSVSITSDTSPANTQYVRVRIRGSGNFMADGVELAADTAIATTSYVPYAAGRVRGTECCEQIKVNMKVGNNDSSYTVYLRVTVNGTTVFTTSSSVTPYITASATIDVRTYEGDLEIVVWAKLSAANSSGVFWASDSTSIGQNQRLPLRGTKPLYAVTNTSESSCEDACEATCQGICQESCQADCQSTCQDACQTVCQSTCEQTSQGGGCWVEGTPVTIQEPGTETTREIPVEQLEPGTLMPYYDTATDTLRLCECVDNQRSLTHTIHVARVEGGHTLEMTGEQPMDVLRDQQWLRVPARYLRVGDQLIRPYDGTLHRVLHVAPENRALTTVYNPRTTAGRYIVHGFADAWSKT